MKVLHVLNSKEFTGAEQVVAMIVRMFAGEAEMPYCSPYSDNVRDMLKKEGMVFCPVESLTPGALKAVIRQEKPDVIHAHDMRASLMAALTCGKIPVINHIHNNAFDARGLSVKSLAYILAAIRAKHILWVSRSSYEGYLFHKLFAKKSSVLYNIIDVAKVLEKCARDENTYDYDAIYIGRLTYQKDPQRLMRLCRRLADRKPDIRIAIVGSGELEGETKALCKELALENNVFFLGFQSNPMKILHDAKALLLTSRWEGTPMCALEALALGVPVVSTPTDGMVDLIGEGEDGYLSDDDAVMAEKVLAIVNDEALHERLSCNAAEKSLKINDVATYKEAIAVHYRKHVRG